VSGQPAATGMERATPSFSPAPKPSIDGRVETRVEAATQPGPQQPPPVHRPPNEEPPGVGSSSSRSTAEPPGDQTYLRPRLYTAIGILAVLGVGALAVAVYWSQGPESDSNAVPPTQATVAVTPIPAEDQQATKIAPAPAKNVFNAAPAVPTKDVSNAVPTLKWKLQNSYPTNMATTLPFLVKRIGTLSDGRMQLEQLPAGAVVPAFQLVDAVSNFLELGYGQGTYLYGKSKTSALMTAVPFGFTTRDHLTFRQRPDTKAAFDELLTGVLKLNVVALPCGAFGRSGEFWLRRPLRSKSDLVGKKLRFTGLAASIYGELGSAVTILPGGEIIAAIDRGLIDGGQFANPTNDLDLGFANVLKYYYYPSSVMPAYILDLYINKGKWDAMPPAGRQIIEQACGEAVDAMITEQDRLDREALAELARRGVNVAPLPAAIERDIFAASEKVLTEYRRDPSFDAVMGIVDQMRASTLASKLR
jgi:TRAP-type mannitol/chloroaromatic compound transport system substrate-binding protein